MAQTGSAQREPSMEEILASIRRIIEDSDTARKPLEDIEPQIVATRPLVPEVEPEHEVEVFEAELHETVERRLPPATWEAEPPSHQDALTAFASSEGGADMGRTSSFDRPALAGGQPAAPFHASAAFSETPEPVQASRNEEITPPAAVERMSDAENESRPDEGRAVLMSDHAGRQVAAAFGELSDAFAASRRRSFDDMAEEMLRPMLQDWLDNNLPTLVERLVREEIERVARGG
jgi:cell pole-organizing protein PopZ